MPKPMLAAGRGRNWEITGLTCQIFNRTAAKASPHDPSWTHERQPPELRQLPIPATPKLRELVWRAEHSRRGSVCYAVVNEYVALRLLTEDELGMDDRLRLANEVPGKIIDVHLPDGLWLRIKPYVPYTEEPVIMAVYDSRDKVLIAY